MAEIKTGDCVQRKDSKGPKMTVVKVKKIASSHEVQVWCDWEENGKTKSESFSATELKVVKS